MCAFYGNQACILFIPHSAFGLMIYYRMIFLYIALNIYYNCTMSWLMYVCMTITVYTLETVYATNVCVNHYLQGDRLELECVYQTVNRSTGLVVSLVITWICGICRGLSLQCMLLSLCRVVLLPLTRCA